jgi:hypothetical protein
MRSAVIVSTARTPIGRAYRGAFNNTALAHAGQPFDQGRGRARRDRSRRGRRRDVRLRAAAGPPGRQHRPHLAAARRSAGQRRGHVARPQCSSGLMAIATAAKQIITDHMDITIGGGVESISLVQTPQMRVAPDPELLAMHKDIYMPMLGPPKSSPSAMASAATRWTNMRSSRSSAPPPPRPPAITTRRSCRSPRRWRRQQGDQGSHDKEVTLGQGRGQPRRHHAGRPEGAAAGDGPGHDDHRGQCQPAFGRLVGQRC